MSDLTDKLDSIADEIRSNLTAKDAAREQALPLCREAIRFSSQAIRAVHRQEFEQTKKLLKSARDVLSQAEQALTGAPELSNTGFLMDAQKECAEGYLLLSLVVKSPLPKPEDLGVDPAAYLNGLAEAASELRRYLLDGIRKGDLSRAEELLSAMDDVYNVLVTMDFPDAITGGLRRTTDMLRGVLERTRSDLTLVIRQKELENLLGKFEGNIK